MKQHRKCISQPTCVVSGPYPLGIISAFEHIFMSNNPILGIINLYLSDLRVSSRAKNIPCSNVQNVSNTKIMLDITVYTVDLMSI